MRHRRFQVLNGRRRAQRTKRRVAGIISRSVQTPARHTDIKVLSDQTVTQTSRSSQAATSPCTAAAAPKVRRANAAIKTARATQGSTRWKQPRHAAEIKELGNELAKAPIASSAEMLKLRQRGKGICRRKWKAPSAVKVSPTTSRLGNVAHHLEETKELRKHREGIQEQGKQSVYIREQVNRRATGQMSRSWEGGA
jgi:hypothetical protein